MAKDSGPESGAKGIVEDIKGKAKEVIGEVTGDDSKEREGRAQQDKAQSQREVAEHEAKADAARALRLRSMKPSSGCTKTNSQESALHDR